MAIVHGGGEEQLQDESNVLQGGSGIPESTVAGEHKLDTTNNPEDTVINEISNNETDIEQGDVKKIHFRKWLALGSIAAGVGGLSTSGILLLRGDGDTSLSSTEFHEDTGTIFGADNPGKTTTTYEYSSTTEVNLLPAPKLPQSDNPEILLYELFDNLEMALNNNSIEHLEYYMVSTDSELGNELINRMAEAEEYKNDTDPSFEYGYDGNVLEYEFNDFERIIKAEVFETIGADTNRIIYEFTIMPTSVFIDSGSGANEETIWLVANTKELGEVLER